jgi:hypothetical protein
VDYTEKGSVLGLMLSGHHLESLNNFLNRKSCNCIVNRNVLDYLVVMIAQLCKMMNIICEFYLN